MTLMTFTAEESARLAPHFTNLDTDVFGLRLPQEVSGALFSRYSRTAKSLRRVFLDEFLGDEGLTLAAGEDSGDDALKRARAFYDRVLVGYGDDSVAQLGGAHVAVERVSNVAAKMLEDGRVGMAYLEKSTRYVRFDQKDESGSWLFHREEKLMASRHKETFLGLMESLFTAYSSWIDPVEAHVARSLPIEMVEVRHPVSGEPLDWAEVSKNELLRKQAERAYRATLRAHACDVVRGLLPGATLTNLGIFGSGQAYEHLLNKLHAQDLSEGAGARTSLRRELDVLIPSFVKRAGRKASLVARDAAARDLAVRWVEGLCRPPSRVAR
jgi:thymidylate synthase ThyX